MKRKICVLTLALALTLTRFSLTASAASKYADVPNNWAEKAIDKWSDLDILTGADGKFRPGDAITHGEMAVILDRLMKYQTAASEVYSAFGQEFYSDAVRQATAAGVMPGDGASIQPTAPMTKEEAAVMLGKALGLKESTAASGFIDSAEISSWASGYVNAMTSRGFIHGYQGAFNPKSLITRAEAVTILDGAISGLYSKPAEYTGDVKGIAIVNTPGVMLKDMTISGDLIIAEGVGSGEVRLKNVTVTGNTIVRGGGSNSVHILGNSRLTNLIIEKTEDGELRVVTADGALVDAVYIDDGNDDIILTGAFKSITLSADVTVKAVSANIEAMMTNADKASLDMDEASSIGTLTLDAAIKVINNGTITKAFINVNGVTIDGNAPVEVRAANGVEGADTGGGSPGGGGGMPGGGHTDDPPPLSFLEGYPKVHIGATIFQATVKTDKVASCFYVAYKQDTTRPAPSAEDIIEGQDGADTDLKYGSILNIPAQSEGTFFVNNLTEATAYEVYIVARAQDGQLSEVRHLSVKTNVRVTVPPPTWAASDNHIYVQASDLDAAKLKNLQYVYEGEFYAANGAWLLSVKDFVTGGANDIAIFMNAMPAEAAYLKVRILEQYDREIWDSDYFEVVSDYSKALTLTIVAPTNAVTSITLNETAGVFTVSRDIPFISENQYILSYSKTEAASKLDQVTLFGQINGNEITFTRLYPGTIGTFTFLECDTATFTLNDDGTASLTISSQSSIALKSLPLETTS